MFRDLFFCVINHNDETPIYTALQFFVKVIHNGERLNRLSSLSLQKKN